MSEVWVTDPIQGYLPAELLKHENGQVHVKLKDPPASSPPLIDASHVTARDPDQVHTDIEKPVQDCCHLDVLNPFTILRNLERRFEQDEVFTNVSKILIAVNPCQTLQQHRKARGVFNPLKGSAKTTEPPHPNVLVHEALFSKDNAKQAIIISGDSGSGKTETAKLVMSCVGEMVKNQGFAEWLQGIHPVAESLGNAATRRNLNSSRYGRSTDLLFLNEGRGAMKTLKLQSCKTSGFLLERSRLFSVAPGEGTFHIFQMLKMSLRTWAEANKPSQRTADLRDCILTVIPSESMYNAICFSRLPLGREVPPFTLDQFVGGLLTVGCSIDNCYEIFAVMIGVLLLCVLSRPTRESKSDRLISGPTLTQHIPQLLGVDADEFIALLSSKVVMGHEKFFREVNDIRRVMKSVAMETYERLFNYIMKKLRVSYSEGGEKKEPRRVSVLDIFGFEDLDRNGLNQLHINYANERLQELFIAQKMRAEVKTLEEQQVLDITVEEIDNVDLINVLSGSVIGPLNDVTLLMRNSPKEEQDLNYIDRLRHQQRSSPAAEYLAVEKDVRLTQKSPGSSPLLRQKTRPMRFTVKHSGQSLAYVVEGWAYQNIDKGLPGLVDLLQDSRWDCVKALKKVDPSSPRAYSPMGLPGREMPQKFRTVSQSFCERIDQLVHLMNERELQFIKCIKPNVALIPRVFERKMVMEQLNRLGIFPLVRILQSCFAHRLPFDKLKEHTREATLNLVRFSDNPRLAVRVLLESAKIDSVHYKVGRSIIFLDHDGIKKFKMWLKAPDTNLLKTNLTQALTQTAKQRWAVLAYACAFMGGLLREYKQRRRINVLRLLTHGWCNQVWVEYLLLRASRILVDSADELTELGFKVKVHPLAAHSPPPPESVPPPPSARTMYSAMSPPTKMQEEPTSAQRCSVKTEVAIEFSPRSRGEHTPRFSLVTQNPLTLMSELDDLPSENIEDLARVAGDKGADGGDNRQGDNRIIQFGQGDGDDNIVKNGDDLVYVESYESFSPKKSARKMIADDSSMGDAGGVTSSESSFRVAPTAWGATTSFAPTTRATTAAVLDSGAIVEGTTDGQSSPLTVTVEAQADPSPAGSPQTVPHPNLHMTYNPPAQSAPPINAPPIYAPPMTALSAEAFTTNLARPQSQTQSPTQSPARPPQSPTQTPQGVTIYPPTHLVGGSTQSPTQSQPPTQSPVGVSFQAAPSPPHSPHPVSSPPGAPSAQPSPASVQQPPQPSPSPLQASPSPSPLQPSPSPSAVSPPTVISVSPRGVPTLPAAAAAALAAHMRGETQPRPQELETPQVPPAPPPSVVSSRGFGGAGLPCVSPLTAEPLEAPEKVMVTTIPIVGPPPPPPSSEIPHTQLTQAQNDLTQGQNDLAPTPMSNMFPTPCPPSSLLIQESSKRRCDESSSILTDSVGASPPAPGVTIEPPQHLMTGQMDHGNVPPTVGAPTPGIGSPNTQLPNLGMPPGGLTMPPGGSLTMPPGGLTMPPGGFTMPPNNLPMPPGVGFQMPGGPGGLPPLHDASLSGMLGQPSAVATDVGTSTIEVTAKPPVKPRCVWRPKVKGIASLAPRSDKPGTPEVLIAHIHDTAWTLFYRTEETQVRLASDSDRTCCVKDLDLNSIYTTPWQQMNYEYRVGPDSLVWRPIDCEALIPSRDGTGVFVIDRKFNVYSATVTEHGRFPRRHLGTLPSDLVGHHTSLSKVVACLHVEDTPDRDTIVLLMRYDDGPPVLILLTSAKHFKKITVCQRATVPVNMDELQCTGTAPLLLWHKTAHSLVVVFEGKVLLYNLQQTPNLLLLQVPEEALHDPLGLLNQTTTCGCEVESHVVLMTATGQVYRLVCDPSRRYIVPKTDLFEALEFPELGVQMVKDFSTTATVKDRVWAGLCAGVCQLPAKKLTCVATGKEGEIVLLSLRGQITSAYRLKPDSEHETLAFRPFGTSSTAKQCMILVCEADWKVLFLDLDLGEILCIKGLPDPALS